MHYSASKNGFYDTSLAYAQLPSDLVEISAASHASLLAAQAAGKIITAGFGGMPVAVDNVVAPLTIEQRTAILLVGVVAWLDAGAQARGYDDIRSAALRSGYPGPYREEGIAFGTWMDSVYAKCYQLLAQFKAGEIAEPTTEALIAMLPALALPA